MTFLPIVERELRVAARRKSTYRVRIFGSLAVFLVICCYLFIISKTGSPGVSAGLIIFRILAWISFAFVCFTGLLTSDAISQERREGTLGLLFLTDLRSYDVVFGKLLSNSVQVFYTLLAIFPMLGLPLLMGGVTGAEFWRTLVVLVNTLFFSVALGIFVSSISRDSQKSLHATFLLIVFFVVVIPLLDWSLDWSNAHRRSFSFLSPGFGILETSNNSYANFWILFLTTNVEAWVFLGLSIYFTPRLWRQKSSGAKTDARRYNQRFGAPEKREKFRLQIMDKNPVYWLALRRRYNGILVKVIVVLVAAFFAWSMLESTVGILRYFSRGLATFVHFALGIWVMGQAARFFVEGWSNGALELLLCSPLSPKQIVQGQWMALKRIFLFPAILIAAVQLIGGLSTLGNYSGARQLSEWASFRGFMIVAGCVNFFASLAALSWVGMWMGLTTKKQNIAVIKTYVFVMILPWFGFAVIQPFIILTFRSVGTIFPFANLFITYGLSFAKDVFFVMWARTKLYTELRQIVSNGGKSGSAAMQVRHRASRRS